MARSFGLTLHPEEEAVAVLAHGPVGAGAAAKGVRDR